MVLYLGTTDNMSLAAFFATIQRGIEKRGRKILHWRTLYFFKVNFLRRQGKTGSFRFPNIKDISVVAKSQICAILHNVNCRRNIYTFSEIENFPFNIE